jgi:glycosyltransferase involved in cell wall biosynthesis
VGKNYIKNKINKKKYIKLIKMKKKIAVLMATHNGELHIEKQLDSIIQQKGNYKIDIYISDDCSKDNTIYICRKKKYKKNIKKIFRVNFKSFSKNFLSLIKKIPKNYDYYAFCDQDDLWLKDKLNRAKKILSQNYSLYCSRTILIDNNLRIIGQSPLFKKKPSFENSLVQSIAGANTMVFNKKIFKNLIKFNVLDAPSHDWLLYLITTGIGENVYYDKISKILYRQHKDNIVGKNNTIKDKIVRVILLFKGKFKSWTKAHIKILNKNYRYLSLQNQKNFLHFKKIRQDRKYLLKSIFKNNLRVYRQTFSGQLMLIIGLFVKLI